jgi:hypothetical protein
MVLVPCRIVHGRARVVQPSSRRVDMAVRPPASEERVVAHGTDLIGVDGQALAVTSIASVSTLCQSNRRRRKKGSTQCKRFHHLGFAERKGEWDGTIRLLSKKWAPSYVVVCEPWSTGSYHPSQTALAMLSQAWYGEDEGTIHFSLLRNTRQREVISRDPRSSRKPKSGRRGLLQWRKKRRTDCEKHLRAPLIDGHAARRQEQAKRIVTRGTNLAATC